MSCEASPRFAVDGARAQRRVAFQVEAGPRLPGTPGHERVRAWIESEIRRLGGRVETQTFTDLTFGKPEELRNVIGHWGPPATERGPLVLCAHYDTRPIADQEENIRKWHEPFLSANDGGSGVAVLMEMANRMKELQTTVGVDFVLFDGEEYIFDPAPGHDRYFFGSEHFAKLYQRNRPR